jgi:colanic acid biosynthesis glycosyl transferase WcaI
MANMITNDKLKILIVTPYYYPENFKINDFSTGLEERGYQISVLSAIPNYPGGKYYEDYTLLKNRYQKIKNIKIFRVPVIPRGGGGTIRLSLNYLSYIIFSILPIRKVLKQKYDLIFVYAPSPATVAIPAIIIKKLMKIPIIYWVHDLWPESIVSAGNLKSGLVPTLLIPVMKYIYKQCDQILVSSKGYINSIAAKGVSRDKIDYFPQWAEQMFTPVQSVDYLLGNVPSDSFKIMFAGNIGEAQDFPSIMEAAKMLKDIKSINWLILGSGRKEPWVRAKIKEFELEDSFHLLGNFPLEKMPEFYAQADAMLFSLKGEYIFSIAVPAKVQSYLACGKPVLAMIDGEGASIIDAAGAGYTCPAEDPESLSKNIIMMKELSEKRISKMGRNARKYYLDNFDRSYLFNKAELIFNTVLAKVS